MSARPSAGELADMQAAVLRSALAASSVMPDRAFLPRDGPAPLLDENLSPELAPQLPPAVRIATATQLDAAGGAHLRFQPPTETDGTLWLTLELRLAHDGAAAAALGGVQVGWQRAGDAWRIAEPARAYGV